MTQVKDAQHSDTDVREVADGFTQIAGEPASGWEYLVDAYGCSARRLRSLGALQALAGDVIGSLGLTPIDPPVWHVFPTPGGITGLVLLRESHLAIHTFPETAFAALSVYSCQRRIEWPWTDRLRDHLGATRVVVRACRRGTVPR